MSHSGERIFMTMKTQANLTTHRYKIVRVAGTPKICDLASDPNAAGTVAMIGILDNEPDSGQNAAVVIFGETKAKFGGSVTAGQLVSTDGSGQCVAAASGNAVVGRALVTAASGDVAAIIVNQAFRLSGAI